MRTYSMISENDFSLFAPVGFSKVADGSTIPNNSWSYNTTYKAARINDASASLKGCFTLPIGYMKKGDVVKVSAEFLNVSGVKGKIALDRSLTSPTGFGNGNSFIAQTENQNGQFEKIEVEFVADFDAYYSVPVGVFTADIGEFYVRNCSVKVDSIVNINPKKFKQGFRTYVILGNSGNYSVQTNFTDDLATLTVDSVNKEINLTHGKAFAGTKAGIATIGENSSGVSPNYRIRTQSFSLTGCKIKIYDVATNTLQDPATISGLLWFSLIFSGMDNEIDVI